MTTRRAVEEAELVPTRKAGLMTADTPAMREWAEELVSRARSEGVHNVAVRRSPLAPGPQASGARSDREEGDRWAAHRPSRTPSASVFRPDAGWRDPQARRAVARSNSAGPVPMSTDPNDTLGGAVQRGGTPGVDSS